MRKGGREGGREGGRREFQKKSKADGTKKKT